jgi:GAF domain-containing protein
MIDHARMRDHEWAQREGMMAFAGYPLLIADQIVGVMTIFARMPFSRNQHAALGSAAQIIAVSIQRQLAEEEMRRNEARFRDLAENINEIFSVADPKQGR